MNRIIVLDEFQQILNYLITKRVPLNLSPTALNTWKKEWDNAIYYKVKGEHEIYRDKKQVIPYERTTDLLTRLWANPNYGGTGIQRFYDKVKSKFIGITKEMITKFLNNVEAYQIHKRVRRGATINPIIPKEPRVYYQIDLIDMSNFGHVNAGNNWILTAIDLFTKKAYAVGIKNKTAASVSAAIREWLDAEQLTPKVLQSDRGDEFKNSTMTTLLAERGIKQQFSLAHLPESQGSVERFNGLLKRELNLYFTAFGANKWIDILSDKVRNYNNSIHSVIRSTPNTAAYKSAIILKRLQQSAQDKLDQNPKYQLLRIGDSVRLALQTTTEYRANTFRKKYLSQWTKEIYKVTNIIPAAPLSTAKYAVVDSQGNPSDRIYFRYQMQKINPMQLITVAMTKAIHQRKKSPSNIAITNNIVASPGGILSPLSIPSPMPALNPITQRPRRNPRPGNGYDIANNIYF